MRAVNPAISRLRDGAPYAAALGIIAVTTLAVELLGRLKLTNGPMLYLAAVLVVALVLRRGPAIVAAISAAIAFDFFFTEPRLTLRVSDPDEWVALLTFLLVAVVVSQLVAAQRERADEAEARRREALVLHDLGEVLAQEPFEAAIRGVAERLRRELGATAAAVEIGGDNNLPSARVIAGDDRAWQAAAGAPFIVLGENGSGQDSGRSPRWIRVAPPRGAKFARGATTVVRAPVRVGSQRIGQISLVDADQPRTLSPAGGRLLATASSQLALAIERERLRGEATEAEVLQRTNDLKSALLNAVSHDLRTPLATIIASAGSLRQTDVAWSAEDRLEFAENIELEAQRLNRIVGNVLDLSRIEGGALRAIRDWHDPSLVLTDAVDRMRAHAHGVELVLEIPDDLSPVLLDPVEVDQVVANLVENAVRHAPPGSAVTVAGEVDDEGLRVRVDDCGRGITESALPRLFEPFYRAPSDARSAGSGIGLAVARGLVAAHGGRIWAENRAGGGARFTFVIPSPRAPQSDEA